MTPTGFTFLICRRLSWSGTLRSSLNAGGLKRLSLASRLLHEAVAKDPLCLEAYLLLSAVYAEKGRFQAAATPIREVLKLNPQHEAAKEHIERYKEQFAPYLGN